ATFALADGIGDREAFEVDVLGKALAPVDEAERAAFLDTRHEVNEGGGIAGAAVAHWQRQSRVHLVAHGLAHAGVDEIELGRSGRSGHAFGGSSDLEL